MADYLHDGILVYLNRLIDWEGYIRDRRGEDVDVDSERGALYAVLETCAQVCRELEPAARAGWSSAARLENGEVVFPEHLARGYRRLREAGLVSLRVHEQYGGADLPALIANVILQMVARADASLMTLIGLQSGISEDIQVFGSEELRRAYLPRFATGELQAAMDLTEPQAGSDLGAITTRAYQEQGRCYLEGEKIFITNGGAEIHLVLARDHDTFEQSRGTTRGLSLFLCPRTLPDGTRNRLRVARLEHKLGIHGSPTAVIQLERAEAFRLGQQGEGFRAMLQLMNAARLGVAAQGVGIAEAALEEALRYSRERKQFGRPIGEHPLLQHMLSRMVLGVEGSRALLYRCCALIDRSHALQARIAREAAELSDTERAETEQIRERSEVSIRLLTPLAKFLATETADQVSRMAIQVHGGIGFMAESTVGHLHLDAMITTIYEGTSEIQISFALKEIGKGALGVVFEDLERELEKMTEEPFAPYAEKVRQGISRIQDAAPALLQDLNYALLCARAMAEMVIHVIVATELLRQAQADRRRLDLAVSWINQKLLELEMLARRVSEGTLERLERSKRIVGLLS